MSKRPGGKGPSTPPHNDEISKGDKDKPSPPLKIDEIKKPLDKKPGDYTISEVKQPSDTDSKHNKHLKEMRDDTGLSTDENSEKPRTGETKETRETREVHPAIAELKMKEYTPEQLAEVEKQDEQLTFVNGHGTEVTRAAAVNEMLEHMKSALDELQKNGREITDEQRKAIIDDMKSTIYAQEAENQSRAIGNHGVPHLHGVFERMASVPQEVLEKAASDIRERNPESQATADDVRAGLILAAAYHDEGYLSENSRDHKDKTHGVDSSIVFEHDHALQLRGVVDAAVLEDVRRAIAEHNGDMPAKDKQGEPIPYTEARAETIDRMREGKTSVKEHPTGSGEIVGDMDPNKSFIRSALLLSDRLALDAEEKMPDVLRDEQRVALVVAAYQDLMPKIAEALEAKKAAMTEAGASQDDIDSALKGLKKQLMQQEAQSPASQELRASLKDMVNADTRLTSETKARYLSAIDKDIATTAGIYDMPMAGVAVPADSLQFTLQTDENGHSYIDAHLDLSHRVVDEEYNRMFLKTEQEGPQAMLDDSAKQVAKMLEDLGISVEVLKQLNVDSREWLKTGRDGVITVQTSAIDENGRHISVSGMEHVTVTFTPAGPDTARKNPEYMENVVISEYERRSEYIENIKSEHEAAVEASLRAEAVKSLKAEAGSAAPTASAIVTACGEAFLDNPEHPDEVLDILKEIQEASAQGETLPSERLRELADRLNGLLTNKDAETKEEK